MPSAVRSHWPPQGPGRNRRTRPERPTGEPRERRPQAVAGERARHGRVGDVDEAVEPVRVRPLVPVEQRPVDEQEPLLGPDLTRRLAEVRCLAALHRGQAVGLRQIEPPQQIVRDERRPRPDDQGERPAGARVRQLAEQLAEADCPGSARRRGRRRAPGRSSGARPLPTAAHAVACRRSRRRLRAGVNAERRPAAARSHATVDAPSTAMTLTPSRAPSSASAS